MATGYRLTPDELKAVQENGSASQKAAAASGQFAQTFNTSIAAQGVRAGATQVPTAKTPPPNASAAPTGSQQNIYTGICAAMNQYEQELVKSGSVEMANIYEVQFAPATLAAEIVTLPGSTDQLATAMQSNQTAKDKLPATNKVNKKSRNWPTWQGQQMVQFIEGVIRNSSYVTKQQKYIQDQLTGDNSPNTPTKTKDTVWFKINTKTVPISDKIDNKRRSKVYRITYTISTYQINEVESQYFDQPSFKGVHKRYDYWFTGQNSQVINFEQKYDKAWKVAVSGQTPTQVGPAMTTLASQVQFGLGPVQYVPSPTSGQSDKGASAGALNPASTLADFLYSAFDQGTLTITIVGDPAWIFQGEVVGLDSTNFIYDGFYPDGTINADQGQAVFVMNWNAPTDYNNGSSGPYSGTGLMDISTSGNTGTDPATNKASSAEARPMAAQASAAYQAIQCISTFSKGKFTQQLQGKLIKNINQKQIDQVIRTPTKQSEVAKPAADVRKPSAQFAETAGGAVTGGAHIGRRRANTQ